MDCTTLTIDIETARRFILGKQGLWPGRRWHAIMDRERQSESHLLKIAREHPEAIVEMRTILQERDTLGGQITITVSEVE